MPVPRGSKDSAAQYSIKSVIFTLICEGFWTFISMYIFRLCHLCHISTHGKLVITGSIADN